MTFLSSKSGFLRTLQHYPLQSLPSHPWKKHLSAEKKTVAAKLLESELFLTNFPTWLVLKRMIFLTVFFHCFPGQLSSLTRFFGFGALRSFAKALKTSGAAWHREVEGLLVFG